MSTPTTSLTSDPSDLARALAACRRSFLTTAFFSLFVNLLMLVPAIYMLAVYDRVLMSGSESTLMMLSLITVFLFLVLGGLEWIRTRILVATSARLDEQLGERLAGLVQRVAGVHQNYHIPISNTASGRPSPVARSAPSWSAPASTTS